MAIHKEIKDNQLYLYLNGNLIYKRWLDSGQSKVFDVMAYDKYTLKSYCDPEYDTATPSLIVVKATLKMKATEEGGRRTPLVSGYRPDHVFEYKNEKVMQAFIGDIQFEGMPVKPGEERIVKIRFLAGQRIEPYLTVGRKWWIHEAEKQLGSAEILHIEA